MLKEVFTSEDAMPYSLVKEATAFGGVTYNEYLITSPRIYHEEIDRIAGAWVSNEINEHSDRTLNALVTVRKTGWPGHDTYLIKWDATYGRFIERNIDTAFVTFSTSGLNLVLGADEQLWYRNTLSFAIKQINPSTLIETGLEYPNTLWEGGAAVNSAAFYVDTIRGVLVAQTSTLGSNVLGVYSLTTGDLLRSVTVVGITQKIFGAGPDTVYAVSQLGILTIVDYTAGLVKAAMQVSLLDPGGLIQIDPEGLAFDKVKKQVVHLRRDPELTDGESQAFWHGYFPIPRATGLLPPIPLKKPRVGEITPIYTKVYGNIGEPIVDLNVTVTSLVGPMTVTRLVDSTDGLGEVRYYGTGSAEGDVTMNIQTDNTI